MNHSLTADKWLSIRAEYTGSIPVQVERKAVSFDLADDKVWSLTLIVVALIGLIIIALKALQDGPTMFLTYSILSILFSACVFGVYRITKES